MSTVAKLKPGQAEPSTSSPSPKSLEKNSPEGPTVADDNDSFVAENYAALKTSGLVEAGVPAELGGGGANVT